MYKAQLTQVPQLTQKTSITPRLQQALKVLNMPLQELTQFISQELEQNPFLELEEEDETALPTEESDPIPEWNEPEENPDREDSTIDIDWETAFEDRVSVSERINSRYSDTDELQSDLGHERSLHEHLDEQLGLAPPEIIASETERAIAEQILGNLNDDGQLELKLFQIPCEFLPELDEGIFSTELHIFIQKNLQAATGDRNIHPNIQLSKLLQLLGQIQCLLPRKMETCLHIAHGKLTTETTKISILYYTNICQATVSQHLSFTNLRWMILPKLLAVIHHSLKLYSVRYKIILNRLG